MNENEIGTKVLDACFDIHRELGAGLFESVYEVVLMRELSKKGFRVERQVQVPISFRGESFDEGFRADLFIERKVIIELKSVEKISPSHKKQLQTYLRLTGMKLGYLINFSEALLKNGIVRCVNKL